MASRNFAFHTGLCVRLQNWLFATQFYTGNENVMDFPENSLSMRQNSNFCQKFCKKNSVFCIDYKNVFCTIIKYVFCMIIKN